MRGHASQEPNGNDATGVPRAGRRRRPRRAPAALRAARGRHLSRRQLAWTHAAPGAGTSQAVVEDEWGKGLIRSWNDAGWIEAPRRTSARIARIVGAEADEVTVADSTSVNLFKLLVAAARLRPDRNVLLSVSGDFPTDRYIADSVAEILGLRAVCAGPEPDAIIAALDERVAVLALCHVDYRTGRINPMSRLTSGSACGRRPRALGSEPQRRSDRHRTRCRGGRFRRRLRIQVPQRRSRGAGVRLRRAPAPRAHSAAAHGLARARAAVRVRGRLRSGRGHRPAPVRHAADDVAAGARSGARGLRWRRPRGAASQESGARRSFHSSHRRAARVATVSRSLRRATATCAGARCRLRIHERTP